MGGEGGGREGGRARGRRRGEGGRGRGRGERKGKGREIVHFGTKFADSYVIFTVGGCWEFFVSIHGSCWSSFR